MFFIYLIVTLFLFFFLCQEFLRLTIDSALGYQITYGDILSIVILYLTTCANLVLTLNCTHF